MFSFFKISILYMPSTKKKCSVGFKLRRTLGSFGLNTSYVEWCSACCKRSDSHAGLSKRVEFCAAAHYNGRCTSLGLSSACAPSFCWCKEGGENLLVGHKKGCCLIAFQPVPSILVF